MKPASSELPLKRLLVRLTVWLLLGSVIFYVILVWWCVRELAEPTRRQIQAGGLPYLDGSANAGFRVESFISKDGMPCVVCVPEKIKDFSKRAKIIRRQLTERGIVPVASGEIVGTLVILHGRGGIKEDYFSVAERFCAVGFRCVIPDLPGHGQNLGKYATYGVLEAKMVLDCFQEAAEKFDFAEQPSAIFGQSMGGSVAVHTAAQEGSPFGAMVVVSSFDRLETVVAGKTNALFGSILGAAVRKPADAVFGWKTGVKFSEIQPVGKAAVINIPTMIVHGDSDKFVPTDSGKLLFESLPEGIGKRWVPVPTANHNNVLVTDFPLYATMAEWFLKNLTIPPSG